MCTCSIHGLVVLLNVIFVGSTPTAGDFEFGTLAIPLTLLCQCLSDETLKAVGPFYLVSMPGEVKDPTSQHWNV